MQTTLLPPRAPQAPQLPDPWVVNEADIPRTGQQVEALQLRQKGLRSELQDAAERRNSIMGRMHGAHPSALPGLEARLRVIDARIVNLETEISKNAAALNRAPAEAVVAGTKQTPDPGVIVAGLIDDIVPIVAIVSTLVFAPIAFAIARFFWRRTSAPARVAGPDPATHQRLEQLQQAVDTIAIEIERISEGQRFVTRLLNERSVGNGEAARSLRMGD